MCEPTTLTIMAMAATAVSGIYAGNAAKAQGEYQNQVAKQNATLENQRAEQAQLRGSIEEENHRAKVRQMIGAQRAGLAANGLDLSSGTALDLVSDTAAFGEEDALMLRFNAMQEAWGHRANAVNYLNEGKGAKWAGSMQRTGTFLSTAGSLLNTASGSGLFSKTKPAPSAPTGIVGPRP